MDNWRKAQIAAKSAGGLTEIIASAHRSTDRTEADWAERCLQALEQSRDPTEDTDDVRDRRIDHARGFDAGLSDEDCPDTPAGAAGWFKGRTHSLYHTNAA